MKNLIFDLDGTLWDATEQIKTVWESVAKDFKINITNTPIQSIMGLTNDEIINLIFNNNIELGKSFLEKCQIREVDYLSHFGANIYSNTIQTIQELYIEHSLYIVSNCQSGYIEAFLKFYNLEKFFKDIECSGNTNLTKAENITLLAKRNNINDAVYIGDTENDYIAATNSNIGFIWASYGFGNCIKYDYKINDIKELLNLTL